MEILLLVGVLLLLAVGRRNCYIVGWTQISQQLWGRLKALHVSLGFSQDLLEKRCRTPTMDSLQGDALPPPRSVPQNMVPFRENVPKPELRLMSRPDFAHKGQPIQLHSNHFGVKVASFDGVFFQYSVSISHADGHPLDARGIGRKIIDRLQEIYHSELAYRHFAYDGEETLFTLGSLPRKQFEFLVVLDDLNSIKTARNGSPEGGGSPDEGDRKRLRRQFQSRSFNVEIRYARKIPMRSLANAIRGQEFDHASQEAVRVLDAILRQRAAKQGFLLLRQSFFPNRPRNCFDLGGGILGCRGFSSSFKTIQDGLSLNIDMTTTAVIKPGPVLEFLLEHQNVKDADGIDWVKAKKTLKNLRIKVRSSNLEYKIKGLSEQCCSKQLFSFKREQKEDPDVQTIEITVSEYFTNYKGIRLDISEMLPCINVGRKKPIYIPLELCSLLPMQRYTKELSTFHKSALVQNSGKTPQERMAAVSDALQNSNYNADSMLHAAGISVSSSFPSIEGRVLVAPKLRLGNGEDLEPQRGKWNFWNKKVFKAAKLEHWAIVNFSACFHAQKLWSDLDRVGQMMGLSVDQPFVIMEENPQDKSAPPHVRVDKMFEKLKRRMPSVPQFILCLIPERNCNIYGHWKKKNLTEFGIINQCFAPLRFNDQVLVNLFLKINVKLGGLNSKLAAEHISSIPLVSKTPTLILGMDVSHGHPGQSEIPSFAAVVSSREWPSISRYRASVRTQAKDEIIASLFKPVSDTVDDGFFAKALMDFCSSSKVRRPEQIIIFRDGVSESQFSQVLNKELDQIIKACKFKDADWHPKFTVIVAQKNHHTRLFQEGSPYNVPPGTVVDKSICHPRHNDFYMCAQAGAIGTTRPTHYHVLLDQIGFSADELQDFVHSLSYVYQRSTTAISIVAPIAHAHNVAFQMAKFPWDEMPETSSSGREVTADGNFPVPELPRLHRNVRNTMFFC